LTIFITAIHASMGMFKVVITLQVYYDTRRYILNGSMDNHQEEVDLKCSVLTLFNYMPNCPEQMN